MLKIKPTGNRARKLLEITQQVIVVEVTAIVSNVHPTQLRNLLLEFHCLIEANNPSVKFGGYACSFHKFAFKLTITQARIICQFVQCENTAGMVH